MLKRCMTAEWLKLKHTKIWIIMITLPMISTLIGCGNFYMNQEVLTSQWYSLWSQVGLFYGEFFFPVLIAILCSVISRLEHYNKNWNMVMTAPVAYWGIFFAKLAVCGILLALVQVFFFLLYYTGGNVLGLSGGLPTEWPGWLFRGWIAALSISALQLALSLKIRSFALPVGIGMCGSFLGLAMYVLHLGMYFPHSLLTTGMGVLSQKGLESGGAHVLFYGMNLLYIAGISWLGVRRLEREDVAS